MNFVRLLTLTVGFSAVLFSPLQGQLPLASTLSAAFALGLACASCWELAASSCYSR